jgi:hypothetical protein
MTVLQVNTANWLSQITSTFTRQSGRPSCMTVVQTWTCICKLYSLILKVPWTLHWNFEVLFGWLNQSWYPAYYTRIIVLVARSIQPILFPNWMFYATYEWVSVRYMSCSWSRRYTCSCIWAIIGTGWIQAFLPLIIGTIDVTRGMLTRQLNMVNSRPQSIAPSQRNLAGQQPQSAASAWMKCRMRLIKDIENVQFS